MAKLYNLARMSTATTGTGTITLGSAVSGYLTFALAGVADGDVVTYGIKDGSNSEIGLGTYTSSGTTLARTTILKSTNSDAAISLSGSAEVYISVSARDLVATTQLGPGATLINGTLTQAVGSSALTIAVKTLAGSDPSANDPVFVVFRNATVATGNYSIITLTAATSVVVSSGSTLGTSNSTAFRIWIVGFNDAGTFRLGVINARSGINIHPLQGWAITSSTAEGGAGAADSAQVFYTGTAVTSKAYAVLGYVSYESGLATAGTWSATGTRLQLYDAGTVPLPGARIQTQRSATGAVATGTTTMPYDDTIPQSGEGTQFLSQAITPTSASNILEVEVVANFSLSTLERIQMALFQDSVANALAATSVVVPATDYSCQEVLSHSILAATTSATTLKMRAGPTAAGTVTFNGQTAARRFGGVYNSYIECREIMA